MYSQNPRSAVPVLFLVFILFTHLAHAQSSGEIRLVDPEEDRPISGVHYLYGDQSGISDEQGILRFRLEEEEVMQLSHVNYGSWRWDSSKLTELISGGVAYRKKVILDLQPVTVIALRASGGPDETGQLDHLDRLDHDGASVLRQFPAISGIRKGGNYGFDPVFRGFKYDRLNIIFNGGQSATAACPNRMDPPTSQMAPNMMERIVILKGPHALRFGNAFGGTVHFLPARLKFSEQPGVYGRVSSEYQSNGAVFRSEAQAGFTGRRYDLSLSGAWSRGDDYRAGDSHPVDAGFSRGSFGFRAGWQLTPDQQFRISGNYNRAGDADFPALPMDLRKDHTWMGHLQHQVTIHRSHLRSWKTSLFGSFVDHRMDNLMKELDPRMVNAATEARTSNLGGRTEGTWFFAEGNLYAGMDLKAENAEGTRTREFVAGPNAGKVFYDNVWQNGHVRKSGVFGEYHRQVGILNVTVSGRMELNNASVSDPDPEFSELYEDLEVTQVNPGLSIGLVRRFGQRFSSGIWLGRVQRSGDLTERYINYFPVGKDPYELVGNPELDPEINHQADWTFQWSAEGISLGLDLFVSYMQGYISSCRDTALIPTMPSSPGVRRFENIDEAWKTGFEWNWYQEIGWGLHHQTGIAYTYAQDLERREPLPEIAPMDFRYTLAGNYLDGKLQPEITFRHVIEQTRISAEYGESVTPSFSLFDIKLTSILNRRIRFSAGVNNLFDVAYYEHLSRPVRGTTRPIYEPGRSFFASLHLTY